MNLDNVSSTLKPATAGNNGGSNLGENSNEGVKLDDIKQQTNLQQQTQNNGLASMFANTGQQVQAGRVQGQQGLAGMLGNYRNMWQPNGGNSYQVVGGVQNII